MEKLYPDLHSSAPPDPLVFRIEEIKCAREELQALKNTRYKIVKKYKKAITGIESARGTLSTISASTGAASVITLATVVGAAVAIPLGIVSASSGALALLIMPVAKYYNKKLTKHMKIFTMLQTKLTAMLMRISRIIDDGQVSDQEFKDLMADKQQLLNQIETLKSQKIVYEVDKNAIKEEVKQELIKNIK